jgi:hypothetical protein
MRALRTAVWRSVWALLISASAVMITASAVTAAAQDRPWKEGTWVAPPDERSYAIETERDILVLADSPSGGTRRFSPIAGEAVKYVSVDDPRGVRVLDQHTGEHTLVLIRQRPKYSADYSAIGGGHFITSVGEGGASLVLEDGSRWDIDPLVRFSVEDWEPNDLITVRRSNDDPAFSFEIDNTSRDDGALANYRRN